jgi:replicative DNA helicase
LYDQKAANLNKSKSGEYQVGMTILSIMINRNDLIKNVETDISLDSFRNKEIQSIVERISEIYSQKGQVTLNDISPMLNTSEISRDLINTILIQESIEKSPMTGQIDNSEKTLNDCIRFFQKRKSRNGSKQARMKMLGMDKSKGNEQEVDQVLAGCHKENIAFHALKKT